MPNSKTCFVIIGYGKRTSYANGKMRELDLNESFTLLIKPVFDALQIPCYRAIDKNISGSIDKLMLQEIKNADIVLADISTLNANVMWELGVRHALKPKHTIMICEKEQMNNIPFDINHFIVHPYTHSEEGIPYKEVERFKTSLTFVIKNLLDHNRLETDSPVFTFLKEELTRKNSALVSHLQSHKTSEKSFSDLMERAEQAKNNKEFQKAILLFDEAKQFAESNMTLKENLPFIIAKQALCTYKSKKPNEQKALEVAEKILEEVKPEQTQDLEVLGICGAIQKRLYEINHNEEHLDKSISFYERGFQLKQDYYNGINTAFMLYMKSNLLRNQGKDWDDINTKAHFIRNSVLEIALKLEEETDFIFKQDAVWILFTIAESFNYKGNFVKQKEYEQKGIKLSKKRKDEFAISSYIEQRNKIETFYFK
ncbi:MAG: TRAFs-binding domain-containing protein [Bacteroidia bacterium]